MNHFEVKWDEQAKELLRKSGNYTLKQIQDEFAQNPENEAVQIELNQPYYVTPVANRRYSVIWRRDDVLDKPVARVSAVVPLKFARVADMALKQRVKNAVLKESEGLLKLDF